MPHAPSDHFKHITMFFCVIVCPPHSFVPRSQLLSDASYILLSAAAAVAALLHKPVWFPVVNEFSIFFVVVGDVVQRQPATDWYWQHLLVRLCWIAAILLCAAAVACLELLSISKDQFIVPVPIRWASFGRAYDNSFRELVVTRRRRGNRGCRSVMRILLANRWTGRWLWWFPPDAFVFTILSSCAQQCATRK